MTLNEQIRALFVTYKGVFQGALSGFVGRWDKISTKVQSTSTVNVYGWLGQSATFREWVGPRVVQAITTFGYTVPNKTKEMTVSIKREDVEDDNLGIYTPLVADMGQETVRDIDQLVFGALKANGTCYDGLTYFHAAHPATFGDDGTPITTAGAPTFANVLLPADGETAVAAWYAMDTSRVIRPVIYQERKAAVFVSKTDLTSENVFNENEFVFGADKRDNVGYSLPQFCIKCTAPLNAENFTKARSMLESMEGDQGKPLGLSLTTVVAPPELRADVDATINVQFNAAGASNPLFHAADTIITPYVK